MDAGRNPQTGSTGTSGTGKKTQVMNNAVSTVFGLMISFTAPELLGLSAAGIHISAFGSWLGAID